MPAEHEPGSNVNSDFSSEVQRIIDAHPTCPPNSADGSLEVARQVRRAKIDAFFADSPELQARALQYEEACAIDDANPGNASVPQPTEASESLWVARSDTLTQFTPEEPIGTGGTADVTLCKTRFAQKTIVIKRLTRNPLDPSRRNELVLWELQTLMKLPHRNIVQIYDAGTLSDGRRDYPYVAMQYVKGRTTLREWVNARLAAADRRTGADKDRARREVFHHGVLAVAVMAGAVQYGHSSDLVHGDVKPENAMIRGENPRVEGGENPSDDSVVLIDFGYVQDPDRMIPMESRGFTDPFVASNDARRRVLRDVYSLGATLLFCTTGRNPPEIRMDGSTDKVAELAKEIHDDDIRAVVRKAMHPDPPQRYQSAREIEEDLRAWLDDKPLPHLGRRYTWLDKERMLIKRCRKRNDIKDHSQFIGDASFLTAIALVVTTIANLVGNMIGASPVVTFERVAMVMNTTAAAIFLGSLCVVGWRRSPSRNMLLPAFALLLAIISIAWFLAPVKVFYPTMVDFNRSVMFIIPLFAVFNILQGCMTPGWKYMQAPGWLFLALSPAVRSIPDWMWERNYLVILLGTFEAICCFNNALLCWRLAKSSDSQVVTSV